MILSINNVGKIKSADIKFDGITVVAGKNNSGKSTIGEVLCSFFSTFSNIDYKIKYYRQREIQRAVVSFFHEYAHLSYFSYKKKIEELVSNFCKSNDSLNEIDDFILEFTKIFKLSGYYNKKEIKSSLERILKYTDEDIQKSIAISSFNSALDGKLKSVYTNENASIVFKIKNQDCTMAFDDKGLNELKLPFHINNTATFINNPFCLDYISNSINDRNFFENDLVYKLGNRLKQEIENNDLPLWTNDEPVAKLRMNELLTDAAKTINGIVPGKILFTDRFVYKTEDGDDIDIASLSTGIKSFMIIKQLLENNQLKEKDILALDEPEIHLHPEWQLLYAELIVLLQREYNLTVFITTHSSTFLEAIDIYSKFYKSKEKCNYYVSRKSDSEKMVTFENVTNKLDVVYKELVTPSVALMHLKESLDETDEED